MLAENDRTLRTISQRQDREFNDSHSLLLQHYINSCT